MIGINELKKIVAESALGALRPIGVETVADDRIRAAVLLGYLLGISNGIRMGAKGHANENTAMGLLRQLDDWVAASYGKGATLFIREINNAAGKARILS